MTDTEVKGERPARRRYDATGRRQAAEARRRLIVDAARARFLRHGYAGTTIAGVAEDAGVSVEMVYKAFRSKPGLVRAVWDQALQGAAGLPAESRSDAVLAEAVDPREVITAWALLSAEVGALAAPVLSLVRAAALLDPEAEELRREIEQARRRRMRHNARALQRAGHLRPGLSVTQAADVMFAFSGWLYEPLRMGAGWSEGDFVDLMERVLSAALLP